MGRLAHLKFREVCIMKLSQFTGSLQLQLGECINSSAMVGFLVYVPMSLTTAFYGDGVQKMTSIVTKSCQMDGQLEFDADGFGLGLVVGLLSQVLLAIFVAKVVSTWRSRKNAPAL